jgi:NADPH:quinone reductase-like Zn-dependent oxidoreductase
MKRRYKIATGVLAILVAGCGILALVVSHASPCPAAQSVAEGPQSFKAIVYRCYGPPEVLHPERMTKPSISGDEVLVRVHAASVNPLDWHYMRGTPYLVRMDAGIGAPHNIRIGVDFSGTVEAVGPRVSKFHPGDEVFGGRMGAFAQYVTIHENRAIALKPTNMTFEQAASVPIAALTALQALRDKGQLKPEQRVLVNGASGGVGSFAVQIARSLGAHVTGVCSTRNVALVRSIGAERVIDYTHEDFTKGTDRYDLIIDTVGNHPLLEIKRNLAPGGKLVIVGGPSTDNWIGPLLPALKATVLSPFVSEKLMPFLAELNQADLLVMRDLMETGKVTPVIDRRYSLDDLPQAIRYLEAGHARGKVVIAVD